MGITEKRPSRSQEQDDRARDLERRGYRTISAIALETEVHVNIVRTLRVAHGFNTVDVHTSKYLNAKDTETLRSLVIRYRENEARMYPGPTKRGVRGDKKR